MNILILIFNQYKYKQFFLSCVHTEYYGNILILKNPKILKSTIVDNQLSINVDDVIPYNNSQTNVSVKFDKKNKSLLVHKDQDLIKVKKNKLKSSKNKHKNDAKDLDSIIISDEDLFSNNSSSKSSLKSRKVLLKNKKNKNKSQIYSNSIIEANSVLDTVENESDINTSLKDILLNNALSVKDLSMKINIPEAEIITYLFLSKSISATVNEVLDLDVCIDIVKHYGFNLISGDSSKLDFHESQLDSNFTSNSIERPPVITILGHVDHGKTTLLDSILNISTVSQERGGITQSVVGYETIHLFDSKQYKLTFLDTPGHEAFTAMRIRGAQITDIVLLVVASDDSLQDQTRESIKYIKDMSLSCIVVLTKIDKSSTNIDNIKDSLSQCGLLCEEWGGDTIVVQVSALTGYNIDSLLSKICLLAKSKDLHADPTQLASGTIIDAVLDQKQGPIATIIIQNGTLKVGNVIASEYLFGKVKSIINSTGLRVQQSFPSSIVKVLCFSALPRAGSHFYCFKNEKAAKEYNNNFSRSCNTDISLNSMNSRIGLDTNVNRKQLKLIIKADTQGSLEAIVSLFSTISQSKVQINFISSSFGNITSNDIDLSIASESPILAFNVNVLPQINILLKKNQIHFKVFHIIYDLFEYVRTLMLNLIDPDYSNVLIGNAVVQNVFRTNRGNVAGCIVSNGKINQDSYIKVYRKNLFIYEGYIKSLKFMKNDVDEVVSPSECGLMSDFYEWQKSDLIEVYEVVIQEKVL
uniref:Translation initiation factor IF-2, chloroplastic n=1 Tax=Kapraunia schneideri TaxID=717899 RepID=A0A1Z1MSI8_9FLOR|nr:translation initiation factor 2 [Kapraunia schneideri]ARW68916.1 translation initiation factor 2 [Kapraunia schneideri]